MKFQEFEEDALCPAPGTGLKSILVVTVDGGTDENPRFLKTMASWAAIFVVRNYKDSRFIVGIRPFLYSQWKTVPVLYLVGVLYFRKLFSITLKHCTNVCHFYASIALKVF